MGSRQLTGAALTASLIKKRLSALYPKVKFSVRSDVFSMGDSVDIRWIDGPRPEAVEAITNQYQCGSFDGMQDIYNYKAIDPSLGCDGAKYVHCNREISAAHKAALTAKAEEHYGALDPNDNSYYYRLAETEKIFFPYLEAEHNQKSSGVAVGNANTVLSSLTMEISKDVDTRDNSDIYVVKIITKVNDFNAVRQAMKPLGGYYSRYKHGFIFKEDPTVALGGMTEDEDIEVALNLSAGDLLLADMKNKEPT